MLSQEQIKQVKEQLFSQIENLPEEQKETAKKQIEEMNEEQIEQLIEQSKGMQQNPAQDQGCIFCSIAENKTPSYKIDENKDAIAVLDINPVSKAHSIIIPKKHEAIENLPSPILSLAKKIAKKIKSKFKPEEIKIETSKIQGHGIISIIPTYKNQKLERKKISEEELEKLQKQLEKKSRPKIIRQTKPEKTRIKIFRRIP